MALLDAARALSEDGLDITVQAAADRARISRATAYRYFSDPVALAVEAALHVTVAPGAEIIGNETDPRKRVHRVTDYYRAFARENEPAFRKFVAGIMSAWRPDGSGPTRIARRKPALELALEAYRDRMPASDFEDMITLLTACGTGFEQHVALSDVCGLSAAEADRVGRLCVDAILDRYEID